MKTDPLNDAIPHAILKIGAPAATGMFFQTLFNVTDTYFAGFVSTSALAALAVSFPIFFVIIALLIGLGAGSQALIANALGRGDEDHAVELWGQAILSAVAVGLAIALYGLFLSTPLFQLIGAKGEVLDHARTYLVPLLCFAPFFLLNAVLNALLTAQGDSAPYRNSLMYGAIANCALNPLFMFGLGPLPGMGVLGIAMATIVIQIGQFAYLWHCCRRTRLAARIAPGCLSPNPKAWTALAKQAGPVALTMATTGIGLFTITYFMGRHGEAAVAAYGIALRIEQMAMLPMIGLTTASLTMTGQNLGAGQLDRVRDAARWLHFFALALMAIGALVVWPARHQLMALFSEDAEVIRLGAAYLAVAATIFPAYALLAIGTSVLQGMKQPTAPMFIGIARHVVGPLVLLSILDIVLGYGLPGIYLGVFTVAWLGGVATTWLVARRLPRSATGI